MGSTPSPTTSALSTTNALPTTNAPPTAITNPKQSLRFTLFSITPNNTFTVRKQLEEHRKKIRPVLPGDPPVGIYLGIIPDGHSDDGDSLSDKVVLLQTVEGDRTHDIHVRADKYFMDEIADLKAQGLVMQSEELDLTAEETVEIRRRLKGGWLERFGIFL
ncbi:MAG: hypothetical protein M1830_005420 [Pleopsidium flavum]|nr:MAG: hypothetical protein M1830_005420 [Pleopsidium flavum]